MKQNFLGLESLILLQIVIVGNLQPLTANAIYGFSLPFLYLLATIGFFLPCNVMVSMLATHYPQTGGAYIWSERAFGKKAGFITVSILWISNLLWYPSILTLLATNIAYLIDPSLSHNKMFLMTFSITAFWAITLINLLGIKVSTKLSIWCSIIGILLPMGLIIAGGIHAYSSGHPLAVSLRVTPLVPDLRHITSIGFLIAIVISLFGT
jgi:amino acid transporter